MRTGWVILFAVLAVGLGAATLFGRYLFNRPTNRAAVKATVSIPKVDIPDDPAIDETPVYSGPVWFREATADSGIDFKHESGDSDEKPFPAANGSGIGALDFDVDGLVDVYFLTGTRFPIDLTRTDPTNRCYRNMGSWHFRDVTEFTGLGFNGYSAGVAVGDYNDDGFPDVFIACYGPDVLYENMGDGTFERREQTAGVADERWATSAAFFDANNDGFLDLYVCNYGKWTLETNKYCGDKERGIRFFCSPRSVEPVADAFYVNQGDGTFREAAAEFGLKVQPGRGQGVVAADVNNDRLIDIYVGNDLTPNFLFLNNGNSTFRDASEISSTAYDVQGQSQAGMGVDAADVDCDGLVDLFVTNFEGEYNTLYKNMSGEIFQDSSYAFNLAADSLPWVGWGTSFVDFDLDTWLDVIITNGHVDANRHRLGQDSPYEEPALLHRNTGNRRFETLKGEGGSYFTTNHVGRALAIADLDNDGDQDVVIGHQNGPPALLDNIISDTFNGVSLQLIGTQGNRRAVGASLVASGGNRIQSSQVKGGMSYLSANDLRQVFAMPAGVDELDVEIQWPGGSTSNIKVSRGKHYMLWEPLGSAAARMIELP